LRDECIFAENIARKNGENNLQGFDSFFGYFEIQTTFIPYSGLLVLFSFLELIFVSGV
jgi:hypothetical protein